MLRKLSIRQLSVAVGALLLSGAAVAQSVFPYSVNDAGPNYPAITDGRTYNPFGRFSGNRGGQAEAPSSSQGAQGATGTARSAGGEVRTPSSVDESHPGHTDGQSMPSMGYGR